MGIKNLSQYIRTNHPEVIKTIHISQFAFKKIAIDVSLYMCKYKTIYGENWLQAFVKLALMLRKNDVHAVFVYDTGAPPEKQQERKERKESKEKNAERIAVLEDALDEYHKTGEVSQTLVDFQNKKKIDGVKNLLGSTKINMNAIEYDITNLKKQLFSITKQDFSATKRLCRRLNMFYTNAPLEAETMCSDLCKRGLVDAVLSEDSDCLAYGAPVFLNKISTKEETCEMIIYEELIKSMNCTPSQFLDFCIMCGCDYNKNIPKVGPVNSMKLIQEYKSIEGIKEHTKYDISILNHIRMRELFNDYEKVDIKIPFNGIPQWERLQEFLIVHNIHINVDHIKHNFVRNVVVIED